MNPGAWFLPDGRSWHVSQSLILQPSVSETHEALAKVQIPGLCPGLLKSEPQGWVRVRARNVPRFFKSSPGESLAHVKSEHCFVGMKSLLIGINSWMWCRKKNMQEWWQIACIFYLIPSFLPWCQKLKTQPFLTQHQSSQELLRKVGMCTETSHFVLNFRKWMNPLIFIHMYILDAPCISGSFHLMGLF